MNILFLAPMPVYQERGSPIAVKMVLEVLSQRGCSVDALVFHEGEDFELPHVTLRRTPALPFVRGIRPGFSVKKLICDVFMFVMALRLVLARRYELVYAVEESVFMALVLKALFRLPYVYDMDSSLAQQMTEKYAALGILSPALNFFEGLAVRHAQAVVPVCDALAEVSAKYRPRKVTVLHDVPQLGSSQPAEKEDLRSLLGINGLLAMYVGNLETYQGIDLLLDGFAQMPDKNVNLVIVGGVPDSVQFYRQRAAQMGIADRVHLIGARPVEYLSSYLAQADILVSPRIKGINTPMKVYSYLASGKPVLATDLRTHTQVLTDSVAVLVKPTPEAMAHGLARLANDAELRRQLGLNGQRLIAERHNYAAFVRTFSDLLDGLALAPQAG